MAAPTKKVPASAATIVRIRGRRGPSDWSPKFDERMLLDLWGQAMTNDPAKNEFKLLVSVATTICL
jgi:hypothetical protein